MPILGLGGDHALHRTTVACFSPWVEVVDKRLAIDGHIEDAQTFVVGHLAGIMAVPRLHEVELNAVEARRRTIRSSGDRQVVPQAVAAKAEELEEFVALGAANVSGDMAL